MAFALLTSGWLIADGMKHFRTGDRYVSVKGLAETDVKADLAAWPIQFRTSATNLNDAKTKLEEHEQMVRDFLIHHNIAADTIEVSRVDVSEELIRANYNAPIQGTRYTLTETLMVRTQDVDTVSKVYTQIGDLVSKGILLGYDNTPQYSFNGLNDIKPEMIAEATRNARAAAQTFADDSGAKIGNIRRATQGYFSILPRDSIGNSSERQQIHKRVRVVSHFDFYLER